MFVQSAHQPPPQVGSTFILMPNRFIAPPTASLRTATRTKAQAVSKFRSKYPSGFHAERSWCLPGCAMATDINEHSRLGACGQRLPLPPSLPAPRRVQTACSLVCLFWPPIRMGELLSLQFELIGARFPLVDVSIQHGALGERDLSCRIDEDDGVRPGTKKGSREQEETD